MFQSGISGPLFYTVGAAINIAMFPIVSVYLKTRAPGAKTFLQVTKFSCLKYGRYDMLNLHIYLYMHKRNWPDGLFYECGHVLMHTQKRIHLLTIQAAFEVLPVPLK